MREFPQFNFGVVGEGEETFFEMLQNINDEDALGKVPGVCFINSKDTYQFGGERSKIFDQDSLPLPAWDMFRPGGEYFIQSLRGCPFACNFCSNPNGRAVRARSAENVVEEIRWLVENMQPKAINFGDEIFIFSHSEENFTFRKVRSQILNVKFHILNVKKNTGERLKIVEENQIELSRLKVKNM